jgi:hypothetical protein
MRAFDPQATLAVHCGNGFDAGWSIPSVVAQDYADII